MTYNFISIDEVIGRVIRNTGTRDTHYIQDMDIWVSEAVKKLRTKYHLVYKRTDVQVHFHRAILPCGIDYIKAIEHNGQRLTPNNGSYLHSREQPISQEIFRSVPYMIPTVEGEFRTESTAIPLCSQDINSCNALACSEHWYEAEMGFLTTSFAEGCIRVHSKGPATDENGFPLIPDQEDYIQSVYMYVRAMMIGAGYSDKIFSYGSCLQEHERLAARALSSIRYPTVDSMDSKIPQLPFTGLMSRYFQDGLLRDQFNRLYF